MTIPVSLAIQFPQLLVPIMSHTWVKELPSIIWNHISSSTDLKLQSESFSVWDQFLTLNFKQYLLINVSSNVNVHPQYNGLQTNNALQCKNYFKSENGFKLHIGGHIKPGLLMATTSDSIFSSVRTTTTGDGVLL